MSTEANIRKPRRRAGVSAIFDRHYIDYRKREKRERNWRANPATGKSEPVGQRYEVRYVDDSGRQKYQRADTQTAAKAIADRLTTELHTGTHIGAKEGQTLFSVIAVRWLASLSIKSAATRVSHTSVLKNHVLPTFEGRELAAIRHSEIVAWVADLQDKELSAATIHRAFVALRGVLSLALRDGLVRADPSAGVKLPKLAGPKDRFLDHVEVARLAAAADLLHQRRRDPARRGRKRTALVLERDDNGVPLVPASSVSADGFAIRFLSYTGLRIGELAALRVSDIDTAKCAVSVSRSVSEADGPVIVGPTKNGKPRRVPIPKSLLPDLLEQLGDRDLADWAFPAAGGGVLRRVNWSKRVLIPAAELADLLPLSAHDLRHTYASLSAAAGLRPEVVSTFMGHADPGFTLRRYVGLFEADMSASADLLDSAMAAGVR